MKYSTFASAMSAWHICLLTSPFQLRFQLYSNKKKSINAAKFYNYE